MANVRRFLTSVTLQAIESACIALANLPRGRRRAWSRYRPWDLLKSHRIAAQLVDGDSLLDIGCGTGHMLAQIGLFKKIAPQGLDLALHPKRFPDIPISVFDGRTLPLPDKSFDATMLCYVLHHLTPADAAAMIAEAVRVTRRKLFLIEDSMPSFGTLYRVRNRIHRFEAGLRYRESSTTYAMPPDESMFLTHDGWRTWLGAQPGIAGVEIESFADVSQHDHHTLIDATLA